MFEIKQDHLMLLVARVYVNPSSVNWVCWVSSPLAGNLDGLQRLFASEKVTP